METIKMVDLNAEYSYIKKEIDGAVASVLKEGLFISGPAVKKFSTHLQKYTQAQNVVTCGNGTDALQLALMALNLPKGAEVIVPAFTYIAPVEVIALLGFKPVLVDVNASTYNISIDAIERAITAKTKAIIPVHLFGQACNMNAIMQLAKKHDLYIIEDNAQSIGCKINGEFTGTIGDVGCLSFFPSKNLGAYGDGGAIMTNNKSLGNKIKGIAQHGQISKKYMHDALGVNSRLDSLQAAILDVKLTHLNAFITKRRDVAKRYNQAFSAIVEIEAPLEDGLSSHVYHQYVVKVKDGKRDALKKDLAEKEIPSMIYYPYLANEQPAYTDLCVVNEPLLNSKTLTKEVLALPIHPFLTNAQQDKIISSVTDFFV